MRRERCIRPQRLTTQYIITHNSCWLAEGTNQVLEFLGINRSCYEHIAAAHQINIIERRAMTVIAMSDLLLSWRAVSLMNHCSPAQERTGTNPR